MARLSKKHQAFIEEYLRCFNATESYMRVYQPSSRTTASANGSRLLGNARISAEIQARIDEKTMTADEVLTRIADHARGDLSKYIWQNGEIDIESMKADGMGHLLKKYRKVVKRTITKDGREYETEYTEAELYPADSAHDKLMKYHGLYDTRPSLGDKERPIEIRIVNDR